MTYFKSILILSLVLASIYACAQGKIKDDNRMKKEIRTAVPIIDSLQLKITAGDNVLYTEFKSNKTTDDFIKMLPITLLMQDLNGREKYSSLSETLSKKDGVKTTFEDGEIAYWLGGGLAVFYHQDNSTIKAGLITIAKLKDGKEYFKDSDNIKVKFEAVRKNQ